MKTTLQNGAGSVSVEEKNSGNDTETDVKKHGKGYLHSIELILKKACVIALAVLVISQAVLSMPSVRSTFFNEGADGEPLGSEAYVFVPCRLELSLTNMDACPELKILVNGEAVDSFQGKKVLLDIKDGDVVEFDASEVLVLPAVQISAASRNIEYLLGKTVKAAGGIVPFTTVKAGN